ncbi:IS6 family transposase [Klebsiella quasipneumoniae subsp. quasipneumoniae]|uniref:DDE-type integrase/transposase/recombinase n=1 Tax=Klebsiella pneumoniae complex TaxID=3390273 RepID=UPI0019402FA1|nr:DDE-type integrase/transposase/recombinase [Klebsiella pneumoniae]MBM5743528.1 IS6 family transposase [Klebsiella pneumoniae]
MNPFKGRHFQRDIILWAVRWYCKYGISYRELQEMLAERGVNVDHSTIYRWVQRYAPEMEKRLRWYWRNPSDLCPWHMDETEGRCPSDVEHRQIKYRNNVIECDHGKLKRIIGATLGFKSMKTAYATIKGIEVMRALRKGQASAFYYGDPLGEMRLVSRVFEM